MMHLNMTLWSRDWEHLYNAKDLTDGELLEYLRWMACNRPAEYAKLMTSFLQKQEREMSATVM
ncbi:MAG: hypothetical protein IJ682_05155 [Lachnospiraceae bacterium]|nr:hypothetical protein [Lachnospiraceae bacterium]